MRQCPTGTAHCRREFQYADGQCTHADSTATENVLSTPGSTQGLAELVTDDDVARLREAAEASRKKKMMAGATEEEEKEEEEVEWMDNDDAPVTNKDKDRASGPSTGEGSGLTA